MSRMFILSAVLEVMGIGAIGTGVGIEVAMGADVGYLAITMGSGVVAAGGLLFAKVVRRPLKRG